MEVFDMRQLRAFQALAETRSFTAAAQRLYLTQSAVSHSIKSLEATLRCCLFDRLGKRIHLTRSGEALLKHANIILGHMKSAAEELGEINAPGRGRIRIGASITICQYVLPQALREFRESFPEYEISVTAGDTAVLLDLLNSGEVDLALTMKRPGDSRLQFRELFRDELGFILSPMHPLARSWQLDSRRMENENFIFYSRSSDTFRLLEAFLKDSRISRETSMELGSMAGIKEMAKIGLGIGVVAPWTALPELEDGSLVFRSARSDAMRRHWGIYMDPRKEGGVAEDVFAGICNTACATIVARERLVLEGTTGTVAEPGG